MRKIKSRLALLLAISSFLLCGFKSSASETLNIDTGTGTLLQFEIDTADNFSMETDSPYILTENDTELGQIIFMDQNLFDSQIEAYEQNDDAKLLDSGDKNGNPYLFYSCYNREKNFTDYNYYIKIENSDVSAVIHTLISEETATKCFNHIKISLPSESENTVKKHDTDISKEPVADQITLNSLTITYDIPTGYTAYEENEDGDFEEDGYCSKFYSYETTDHYISAYLELMSSESWEWKSEEEYLESAKASYDYMDYKNVTVSDIIEIKNELGTSKTLLFSYKDNGKTCYASNSVQYVNDFIYTVTFNTYDGTEIPIEDIESFLMLR